MLRPRSTLAIAFVTLWGCAEAFTAHPKVAARIDGEELSVDRLARLLVLAQPLPLRTDVASEIAKHWIDVTALALRSAAGDSLLDSTTILQSMWLPVEDDLVRNLRRRMLEQTPFSPTTVDSAYRAGNLRAIAHILRKVDSGATTETINQQRAAAERIRARILAGGSWAQANEENEDDRARAANGLFGVISRGQTVPRFENAAFELMPGEVSDVVRTPVGFHILFRPNLEDVRSVYSESVRQAVYARSWFTFGQNLVSQHQFAVDALAPQRVREAARDPWHVAAPNDVVATYHDGSTTVGEVARILTYLSPQTQRDMAAAPDSQLIDFTRQIVLRKLLAEQADSTGVQPSDSTITALLTEYRDVLLGIWQRARIAPDSLASETSSAEQRQQVALQRVDEYLDATASRRVPLYPIPPFITVSLLRDRRWEVNSRGIERSLELASRLIAATDSTRAPSSSQP